MSPVVRAFVLGFVFGFVICLGCINYYGGPGGTWLIEMGQKMRKAAETKSKPDDSTTVANN